MPVDKEMLRSILAQTGEENLTDDIYNRSVAKELKSAELVKDEYSSLFDDLDTFKVTAPGDFDRKYGSKLKQLQPKADSSAVGMLKASIAQAGPFDFEAIKKPVISKKEMSMQEYFGQTPAEDGGNYIWDAISRGIDNDQGFLYAMGGLVADSLGAAKLADGLMKNANENWELAEKTGKTYAMEDNPLAWAGQLVLEQVPSMVMTLGSGLAAKGATKLALGTLTKTAVKKAMEKSVAEGVVGKLGKEAAEKFAKETVKDEMVEAVSKVGLRDAFTTKGRDAFFTSFGKEFGDDAAKAALGQTRKMSLGNVAAPGIAMGLYGAMATDGDIVKDLFDEHKRLVAAGVDAKEPTLGDLGLGGFVAPMFDMFFPAAIAKQVGIIGGASKSLVPEFLQTASKTVEGKKVIRGITEVVGKGVLMEGGAEAAQAVVAETTKKLYMDAYKSGKVTEDQKMSIAEYLLRPEALMRYVAEFMGGAVVGGALGGVAHAYENMAIKKEDAKVEQVLQNAINEKLGKEKADAEAQAKAKAEAEKTYDGLYTPEIDFLFDKVNHKEDFNIAEGTRQTMAMQEKDYLTRQKGKELAAATDDTQKAEITKKYDEQIAALNVKPEKEPAKEKPVKPTKAEKKKKAVAEDLNTQILDVDKQIKDLDPAEGVKRAELTTQKTDLQGKLEELTNPKPKAEPIKLTPRQQKIESLTSAIAAEKSPDIKAGLEKQLAREQEAFTKEQQIIAEKKPRVELLNEIVALNKLDIDADIKTEAVAKVRAKLAQLDDMDIEAAMGGQAPAPQAQAQVSQGTTFTTERGGSVYTVSPEGKTQRTKGASGGVHTGDVGLKELSDKTFYISEADARDYASRIYASVGEDNENKRNTLQVTPNGELEITYYQGRDSSGGLIEKKKILKSESAPRVGLHPVEFLPGKKIHVGSKIDQVNQAQAPVELDATEVMDQAEIQFDEQAPVVNEQAPMPAQDINEAKTGEPITISGWRGEGKPKEEIYRGAQVAIAGEGRYIASTEQEARGYGDKVQQESVTLQNPLVVSTDTEWRSLVKTARWPYPNITGLKEEDVKKLTSALQKSIQDQGHDGLVITLSSNGDEAKTLRNVFGHDQAIIYTKLNSPEVSLTEPQSNQGVSNAVQSQSPISNSSLTITSEGSSISNSRGLQETAPLVLYQSPEGETLSDKTLDLIYGYKGGVVNQSRVHLPGTIDSSNSIASVEGGKVQAFKDDLNRTVVVSVSNPVQSGHRLIKGHNATLVTSEVGKTISVNITTDERSTDSERRKHQYVLASELGWGHFSPDGIFHKLAISALKMFTDVNSFMSDVASDMKTIFGDLIFISGGGSDVYVTISPTAEKIPPKFETVRKAFEESVNKNIVKHYKDNSLNGMNLSSIEGVDEKAGDTWAGFRIELGPSAAELKKMAEDTQAFFNSILPDGRGLLIWDDLAEKLPDMATIIAKGKLSFVLDTQESWGDYNAQAYIQRKDYGHIIHINPNVPAGVTRLHAALHELGHFIDSRYFRSARGKLMTEGKFIERWKNYAEGVVKNGADESAKFVRDAYKPELWSTEYFAESVAEWLLRNSKITQGLKLTGGAPINERTQILDTTINLIQEMLDAGVIDNAISYDRSRWEGSDVVDPTNINQVKVYGVLKSGKKSKVLGQDVDPQFALPTNQEVSTGTSIEVLNNWLGQNTPGFLANANIQVVTSERFPQGGKWQGAYENGTIYINADTMTGADMKRILFHEALGHAVARNVLGKDYDGVMRTLLKELKRSLAGKEDITVGGTSLRALLKTYEDQLFTKDGKIDPRMAEELWAKYIEAHAEGRLSDKNILFKIFEAIRDWVIKATGFEVRTLSAVDRLAARAVRFAEFSSAGMGNARISSDVQFMLGGETSGDSLQAKYLESMGENRDSIWDKTGWYRGVDGKWRFEIDDSDLAWNENTGGRRFKVRLDMGMSPNSKLGDSINANKVFKAYPWLKDVTLTRDVGTAGAKFDTSNNTITLGQNILKNPDVTNQEVLEILAHEMQHAIQLKEGFARGGSPSEFSMQDETRVINLTNQMYEVLNSETGKLLEKAGKDIVKILKIKRENPIEYQKVADVLSKLDTSNFDIAKDKLNKMDKLNSRDTKYKLLAGEAEARVVERRFNMDSEARKAEAPWVTLEKMLIDEGLLKAGQSPESVLTVKLEKAQFARATTPSSQPVDERAAKDGMRILGFKMPRMFEDVAILGEVEHALKVNDVNAFDKLLRPGQWIAEKMFESVPQLRKMFMTLTEMSDRHREIFNQLSFHALPFLKANKTDKIAIEKVLVQGDIDGVEHATAQAAGLTAEQFKLYQSVRTSLNKARDHMVADAERAIAAMEARIKGQENLAPIINNQIKDLKASVGALKKLTGYIPRVRPQNAQYELQYMLDDKIHSEYIDIKGTPGIRAGERRIKELVAKGAQPIGGANEIKVLERPANFYDQSSLSKTEIAELHNILSSVLKDKDGNPLDGVDDLLKALFYAKGFSKHYIRRQKANLTKEGVEIAAGTTEGEQDNGTSVIHGYQTDNLDLVLRDYFQGLAGQSSKSETSMKLMDIFEETDADGRQVFDPSNPKRIGAYAKAKEFLKAAKGAGKEYGTAVRAINTIQFHALIGLRFSSALWNMTHVHMFGSGLLRTEMMKAKMKNTPSFLEMSKQFASSHKDAMVFIKAIKPKLETTANAKVTLEEMGWGPDKANLLDAMNKYFAAANGSTLSEQLYSEAFGKDAGVPKSMMAQYTKWSGWMMHHSELSNKLASFQMHYQNMGQNFDEAKHFVRLLNGSYEKFNMPGYLQGEGMASAAAQIMLNTFRTHVLNTYEIMGSMWKYDKAAFAYSMAAATIMAGVPGKMMLDMLIRLIWGVAEGEDQFQGSYERMNEDLFGRGVAKFMKGGIANWMDFVDPSASIGISSHPAVDALSYLTGHNREIALAAPVTGFIKAMSGEAPAYKLMPIKGIQSLFQSISDSEQLQIGSRRIFNSDGTPMKLAAWESGLVALGLNPARRSGASSDIWEDYQVNDFFNNQKSSIVNAMQQARTVYEKIEAGKQAQEFNKSLMEVKRNPTYSNVIKTKPISPADAKRSARGEKTLSREL